MPTSEYLNILSQRGFIHQSTDLEGLDCHFQKHQVTAYIGFDCTAPSLHVGSLLSIMLLRWLQKTGNKPIVLLGGGTTRVGDPSGKDVSRLLLDDKTINNNMNSIRNVFETFLAFGEKPTDATFVNNASWLDELKYIPFLREIGQHFSINRMLNFDSVRLRLERQQPLSFLEFNYMILQAYDFFELSRQYNCSLQMGGSDQWGNIVNGVEIIRRINGNEVFGLTTPLITSASGIKMGKTVKGAIWLNRTMKSPYEYWQFWRNTEDNDVIRFLKLFTELPLAEIDRLESLQGNEINEAKIRLANEATTLLHGQKAAAESAQTAKEIFQEGGIGSHIPTHHISLVRVADQITVLDLLRDSGLSKSNSDARRLIKQGGIKVNDLRVETEGHAVGLHDFENGGRLKLSRGKKDHVIFEIKR